MPREVLVSYAHADRYQVLGLVEALVDKGFDVWWDERIGAGESWRRVLLQKLLTVDGVIVCWSPRSVTRDYVLEEARLAAQRAILIPIFLERCDLPSPFDEIQALDLSNWQGDDRHPQVRNLLSALARNFRERETEEWLHKAMVALSRDLESLDLAAVRYDASNGSAVAQSILGHAYAVGCPGLEKDLNSAIAWLVKAANRGQVSAMATLGSVYGLLQVEADWPRAVDWFQQAVEHGDADSAEELAVIYETGFDGVDRDLTLADYYRIRAEELRERRSTGTARYGSGAVLTLIFLLLAVILIIAIWRWP